MIGSIDEIVQEWLTGLPEGLVRHIDRVEKLAAEFAVAHGLDADRIRLCAQAHDLCRSMKGRDLLAKARELDIPIHPVEENAPILLHGQIAAELLRLKGLDDEVVYQGIYHHSVAYPGLHPISKAVFLADKLEPNKAGRYSFSSEDLKVKALHNLDDALLEFLRHEIGAFLSRGQTVHPSSIETLNDLLLKRSTPRP